MRKRKKGRKFHRETGPRKALLKSLASSLILKERIRTTEAKAKELRPFIEKYITQARKGGLANRRLIGKIFSDKAAKKLFSDIGLRYKDRQGGYTRIIKLGYRRGDEAKIAIIELV